ncbi:MAG: hypothetical protein ABI395_07855 [Sphingobium sp.]
MPRKFALDDPDVATTAWARFRQLMRWMALCGAVCVGVVLGILYIWGVPMPLPMILATIGGVWCTFMLGTALMSLVFLSSGTGHDEQIEDRLKQEGEYDD